MSQVPKEIVIALNKDGHYTALRVYNTESGRVDGISTSRIPDPIFKQDKLQQDAQSLDLASCTYPDIAENSEQALTIIAITTDNHYLAVTNLGNTLLLTELDLRHTNFYLTNIRIENGSIRPLGRLAKQDKIALDTAAIKTFQQVKSRVSAISGMSIGKYVITPTNEIMFSSLDDCSPCDTFIILPGTTKIGPLALESLKAKEINIPSTVNSIGQSSFRGNKYVEHLVLPENITKLGPSTFKDCMNLTSIVLPTELAAIKDGAFKNCRHIKEIVIPNKIKTIAHGTFSCCSSLSKVTLPSSLTAIEPFAFELCTNLRSIDLPTGLARINRRAFSQCGITKIKIPDTVTNIGDQAFDGCSNLKNIYLMGTNGSIPGSPWGAPENCTIHWID